MSRVIFVSSSVRLVLVSVLLVLTMTLSWAAVAQAQGPAGDEYGDQAAPGVRAIAAATIGGDGAGGGGTSGGDTGGGGGVVEALTMLPETGGALLPFVAFGVFALSSAGLLVLRQRESR